MAKTQPSKSLVLVVDFGAQYAQLIARRVREANIYSEIVPSTMSASELLAKKPSAIILSGGPSSVYAHNAPSIDEGIFDGNVPMFGICYGFQLMAHAMGGKVIKTGKSEFGRTELNVGRSGALLKGAPEKQSVWMSHGDAVVEAPSGFTLLAETKRTPVAAFENLRKKFAGVQYHPEVLHSEYGTQALRNFLYDIAKIKPDWTNDTIIEEQIALVREKVGDAHVICGLSGGVDSAVAAAVVQRAVGDKLTCVFIDHGLLRQDEAKQVEKDYVAATGINLKVVDAKKQFLSALKGVTDPERKRKIVGREFIRSFERAALEIVKEEGGVKFLVQGMLYPDVVESGGGTGTSNIKSHHNVGGLPKDLKFELVEPLRTLFKDEVRQIGRRLGLPEEIVGRHPFPGPGLAVRIVGEVNAKHLAILRRADAIARQELTAAGLDSLIWQCPVVLLAGVKSVGVKGDGRSYGYPIVLRPVTAEDGMTADWTRVPYEVLEKISTRITNEVDEVNRVVLDITSKPPGTIEWE